MMITQYLDFDVPRRRQPFFQKDRVVAKRRACLAFGTLDRRQQVGFRLNDSHTATTATCRRFDKHRITDVRSRSDDVGCFGDFDTG